MSSTLDRVATTPTIPPKVTSSAGRTTAQRFLPPVVVAVVAVLIWWVATVLVDSLMFPTPAEAMASLVEDLGKADFRANVGDSLRILVPAFLASTVVSSLLGLTLD